MARNPNVVPGGGGLQPFLRAVSSRPSGEPLCPICGSADVRRSERRGFLDAILACLFLAPFRCRLCRERFYRFWRPFQSIAEPPDTPVFVMRRPVYEIAPPEPPASDQLPAGTAAPTTDSARFRPQRSISLCEGDISIRKLLQRLLERRGYAVEEVHDASDLLAQLRERQMDLLVVDVEHLDPETRDAVRSLNGVRAGLKLLLLLAEPVTIHEPDTRVAILVKPFSLDAFLECVERLLESDASSTTR